MAFTLRFNGSLISLDQPLVMGIMNLTPDSFHVGSRQATIDAALHTAEAMLGDGATFLDVGGQSTRPGAERIDAETEAARVIPVIDALARRFPNTCISVDTFYGDVARRAADAGARMINDVSAFRFDPDLFQAVVELQLPYVLMHMQGEPATMQLKPRYSDVVGEVFSFFSTHIQALRKAGVSDILLDPGFGFGKTTEHNFELLRRLDELQAFELPILAGISRKGMIWKTLNITPEEALNGSTVAHVLALQNGARILRVHDVKPAVEAIAILQQVNTFTA